VPTFAPIAGDGQQADTTEARLYDLRNALQQLDLIKSRPPEALLSPEATAF